MLMISDLISSWKVTDQNFDLFKHELTNIINTFIDSLNTIKQELFILWKDKHEKDRKSNMETKHTVGVKHTLRVSSE